MLEAAHQHRQGGLGQGLARGLARSFGAGFRRVKGAWRQGLGQKGLQGFGDLLAPFWFAGSEPSLCIRKGGNRQGAGTRVHRGGATGLRQELHQLAPQGIELGDGQEQARG